WKVYSFVGDQQLNAGDDANTIKQFELKFDSTGKLSEPTTPITFMGFLAPGATSEQVLKLDLTQGTTQV
ncbi:flagellar basal body FlgE domain-containing protein, partial [Escherichia coli]|uniref:flagellar basal body FlgE domain-containing protein n=2 Tax=Pseudomonadota TaxID=1224 RepID=UPI001952A527